MKISAPRTAGSDLPVGHNVSRCKTCQVAFAWKPAGPVASVTCPLCGRSLATTTRRLAAGFVVLTPAQVKAIQDGNGFTARKAEYRAIVTPGSRWWSNGRWQAEKAFWAQIKGQPVAIGLATPAPVAKAPVVARQGKLLDAAIAKLAKWDANPRCKWCLDYRAGRKTDLCAHHAESATYGHTRPDEWDQRQRTWNLRNRAELASRVRHYGGTPTTVQYDEDIEGLR